MGGWFSVSVQLKLYDGVNWWFSGVYGPRRCNKWKEFWKELAGLFGGVIIGRSLGKNWLDYLVIVI